MRRLMFKPVFCSARCWLLFALLFLASCYKDDLDEFKDIRSYKISREVAVSLFKGTLQIHDSIPYLEALNLSDTVSLGTLLGHTAEFTGVQSVELKMIVKNSFPVHGFVQFYFVDEQGRFTDSLFNIQRNPIPPGSPEDYSESVVYMYMDNDKFQRLLNASDLQVIYFLDTPGNRDLPYYELNIEMGIKVKTSK
jgi:hypothetical protein